MSFPAQKIVISKQKRWITTKLNQESDFSMFDKTAMCRELQCIFLLAKRITFLTEYKLLVIH